MNDNIIDQFPGLKRKVNGTSCIYFDGPAGTQVPNKVINAISQYYRRSNANTHGMFATSHETDNLLEGTRKKVAHLLGAQGMHNISFGQNMTTLNYSLARSVGRHFQRGDEILITQLDHEANRGPWLSLKQEGLIVREVKLLANGLLDYQDFADKINERTRLVCMGWASNITGTVNDVALVRKLTHEAGAWLLLDAVHYAPHFRINVNEVGCDFLLCSAYKFYGPHVGLLYARTGLLDQLPIDRLRTAGQQAPYSIETGTLNHAAIAGVKASIEFLESLAPSKDSPEKLNNAFHVLTSHEHELAKNLHDGIANLTGYKVIGPDFSGRQRAPTISFTNSTYSAAEICNKLAAQNIFAWDGHFYAMRATEVLGLLEEGGVTRMGMSVYNQNSEVEKTLSVLANF